MSKSQSVKKRMTLKDLNTWTALIWASSEGHLQRVALIKAVRDRTQDTNELKIVVILSTFTQALILVIFLK